MLVAAIVAALGPLAAIAPEEDRERAERLYREGRYPEALLAFQAALADAPDDAGLRFNLALAAWRAEQVEVAERAAERVLVDGDPAQAGRARALLGALRYERARALEGEDLGAALDAAERSVEHFLEAVAAPDVEAGVQRNAERALRLVERLREAEEEQEPEQQDGDESPESQEPDGEVAEDPEAGDESSGDQPENEPQAPQEPDEQSGSENGDPGQEPDPQGSDPKQPDPEKPGDATQEAKDPATGEDAKPSDTPEPDPEAGKKGEGPESPDGDETEAEREPSGGESDEPTEPGDAAPGGEPKDADSDAPKPSGTAQEGSNAAAQPMQLSDEQRQDLLDRLNDRQALRQEVRRRQRTTRQGGKRDW